MSKVLDRYGLSVGQGMATFLSTGNVTSQSGLDLMQVFYNILEGVYGMHMSFCVCTIDIRAYIYVSYVFYVDMYM